MTSARALAADAAALLLFTTVGLLSHGFEAAGYLRDGLPLLAAWLCVGAALGLYRRPTWRRLAATWAVGVPLAVLVRALVLGRDLDGDQASFLGVTLVFSALFVLGARRLAGALP